MIRIIRILIASLFQAACTILPTMVQSVSEICPVSADTQHEFFGPPDSDELVIFVHGFCGDTKTTWINPDTRFNFPRELAQDLAEQNEPAYLFSFSYVSHVTGGASILSIADHLNFEIGELLKAHPYRRLRIVAHSMGGIIAREYILRRHYQSHPELKITNIVLLASPTNGSELAEFRRLMPEHRQIEEIRHLDKGNTYLESLNRDWNSQFKGGGHPRHLLFYAGFEELPMKIIGRVVKMSSAITYADDSMGFQRTHVTISKPVNREDVVYRWVKASLQESLEATARRLLEGMIQQGLVKLGNASQQVARMTELLQNLQDLTSSDLKEVVGYVKAGQFEKALGQLAESESQESAYIDKVAQRRFTKGQIYELQFQTEQAADYYSQAVRLVPANAFYRLRYGLLLYHAGDARGAIAQFEHGLALSRESDNAIIEATMLGNLGNTYQALSNYDKSAEFYEKALTVYRRNGPLQDEALCLQNLGGVHHSKGEYSMAIEYYEKALAISRKIGDQQGEGRTLGNLGGTYSELGDYTNAIKFYEQAIATDRKIGNLRSEARALGGLGLVYSNIGDFVRAKEGQEQALVILRKIGDRFYEGRTLGRLGATYHGLRDYRKAIEFHTQALDIGRAIGDQAGEAEALGNIGVAHQGLREYHKAIEFQEEALVLSRKIGYFRLEAQTLGNLGISYKALEQYSKATEFLEQSRILFDERLKVPFPFKNALESIRH